MHNKRLLRARTTTEAGLNQLHSGMRAARVIRASEQIGNFAKWIGDPVWKKTPLPLTWRFAALCAAFCIVSWTLAPFLIIWTITPALFVITFLLHRFMKWAADVSQDGFVAAVGFILLTVGTAFQLAALIV